ncbi:hypothetical protein [Comamonas sp. A7-5]|uniref:hypothetical protein n=1 Tax=Comamonas sp. A7-5 TaxID=673549 RepID=UPI0031D84CE2
MGSAWKFVTDLFRKISPSIPFVLLAIAVGLYFWGFHISTTTYINKEIFKDILYSCASAMLSGGVFAAFLKSIQFLGVFEDAMKKIMIKNEWITSLSSSELSSLLDQILKTAVSKGFPQVSSRLSNDIFNNFIPKLSDFYYSGMERHLKFKSYDKETDILEYIELFKLTINSHSADIAFPYNFKLTYGKDEILGKAATLDKLTINDTCYVKEHKIEDNDIEKSSALSCEVSLTGSQKYEVVRRIVKRTRVSNDPVMQMTSTRFSDGMQLWVDTGTTGLQVDIYPVGIDTQHLVQQETTEPTTNYRWTVDQLTFPGDGLTVVVKKP